MSQVERRTLKMHPRLLWDVIHKQAGSIGKAILEGVMNSVDAGATYCDVTIDRNTFSISDDGKGFASDEEINKFFETFGYPHKDGDAKYGRFRMGRGQMMAFGRNLWLTNEYKMVVDLKPQQDEMGEDYALGYEFEKQNERHAGCSVAVDLYDKLTPSSLDSVSREITDYVKYVDIPVRLNGKLISTDPRLENWDDETPDAYIKHKASGTLDVYNQGVLVSKFSSYMHGVSGVVVSKTALGVNFARNDVDSTCTTWKRIIKKLKKDALDNVKRNKPLTETERDFLLRGLATGEVDLKTVDTSRIITDVTGSHHPVSVLFNLSRMKNRISIAPRGDRVAEMAHTRKMAFVLSDECAARFGATTPSELASIIKAIANSNGEYCPMLEGVSREDFEQVISSNHEPLKDSELNKAERMALKAIRAGADELYRCGYFLDRRSGSDTFAKSASRNGPPYSPRKINAGLSDTAQGWTDGSSYIFIERKMLKLVKQGLPGMNRLAGLLLHEYLHNGPDTGTHEHGVEFYERFHNLALDTDLLTKASAEMLRTILKDIRLDGKNVAQSMSKWEDGAEKLADHGIGEGLDSENPKPEIEAAPISSRRAKPEIEDIPSPQISMGF